MHWTNSTFDILFIPCTAGWNFPLVLKYFWKARSKFIYAYKNEGKPVYIMCKEKLNDQQRNDLCYILYVAASTKASRIWSSQQTFSHQSDFAERNHTKLTQKCILMLLRCQCKEHRGCGAQMDWRILIQCCSSMHRDLEWWMVWLRETRGEKKLKCVVKLNPVTLQISKCKDQSGEKVKQRPIYEIFQTLTKCNIH